MWVFMNDSFFSAVEHRNDSDLVVVRSRIEGDLETAFQCDAKDVEVSDESDYRFRITITKDELKAALNTYVDNYLDYCNFKGSIDKSDKQRYNAYTEVWYKMLNWQEKLYGVSMMWKTYLRQRYGDDHQL